MLRRGRGYRDHEYLLLKGPAGPATRRLQQAAWTRASSQNPVQTE
jgi:hypothetical protein